MLGPERTLRPDHLLREFLRQPRRHRFVIQNRVDIDRVAVVSKAKFIPVRVVKIVRRRIGVHEFMPEGCLIFQIANLAHPELRRISLRREVISGEGIAPDSSGAAPGIEIAQNLVRKPALQSILIRKIEGLPACLAVRAVFPVILSRLIAADMDRLRREDVHHLIQYIFAEGKALIPAGTDEVRKNSGSCFDRY